MVDTPAGQLQRAREQARDRLADGYAQDLIDQDQLDERMEAVERAGSIAEIDVITADLRPIETAALVPVSTAAVAAVEAQQLRVLFGNLERGGRWTVAARTRIRVTLGSATLDLRGAVLPDGPIELEVRLVFASLDLIIPPGWQLENECGAILGSVEQHSGPAAAHNRRLLRITGRAILSSLTIQERLPGERAWDARKRHRRERKALAERAAKALPAGED